MSTWGWQYVHVQMHQHTQRLTGCQQPQHPSAPAQGITELSLASCSGLGFTRTDAGVAADCRGSTRRGEAACSQGQTKGGSQTGWTAGRRGAAGSDSRQAPCLDWTQPHGVCGRGLLSTIRACMQQMMQHLSPLCSVPLCDP